MRPSATRAVSQLTVPDFPAAAPADSPLPAGSAALRAVALMERVASAERSATLDELAKATSLSKPTAFRLLALLERAGMLLRDPVADKRYTVGPRLAAFALDVLRNSTLRTERHAILKHLVETIGETCNVTLLDGKEVIYLDRVETHWPLRLHLHTGSRVPLHCSSSGKLFLSQMPPARREKLLGQWPLERFTTHTIVERAALDQELARVRAEGVGADNEEFLAGIVCLAVPVRDASGEMFAAVAVQAPVARLTLEGCHRHLDTLRAAATALAQTFALEDDAASPQSPAPRRKPRRPTAALASRK